MVGLAALSYTATMVQLDMPIDLRWQLPDDFAGLIRNHPFKLVAIPKGERGVAIALQIYPVGTVEWTPVENTCPLCLKTAA